MAETAGQAAPNGQLVKIGTVAAANIAAATGLQEHVKVIESAIADEINAMSAHFTLAISDVQTEYQVELNKIKSAYTYVKANKGTVIAVVVLAFLVGAIFGKLV